MRDKPWFHEGINRAQSSKLLEPLLSDGAFLVRTSTKDPNQPFTIDVRKNGRMFHIPIRKKVGRVFAIGQSETPGEMVRASLRITCVISHSIRTKEIEVWSSG